MPRYAVNAPDVLSAANRLANLAHEPFEERSSGYWGEYCLFHALLNRSEVLVFSNLDPMYRSHLDPPEDRLFEPHLDEKMILIDQEREDDGQIEALIRRAFPDALKLSRATAE